MVFCALKPHLTREVFEQLHEILRDHRFQAADLRDWAYVFIFSRYCCTSFWYSQSFLCCLW
jgi:hypothetical protein